MNLAEKLIYLRKKQGLTQLELAEKLDISRQAVSRWEVGTAVPSIENLKILSAVYKTPVDYFINDGTDGFAKDEDTKEIGRKEDNRKSRLHKFRRICIGISVFIILAVIVSVVIASVYKTGEITPIGSLITEEDDDLSTVTFPIE